MTTRFGMLGRSLAVTLTAGVALGVAGCGNENTGPGFASSGSSGPAYADKALTKDEILRVAAAAAQKAGSAHITMAMTGKANLTASGDVAYGKGERPTMAMTMAMPQLGKGRLQMRYVGGLLYMQIPGMTPPGKYVAIDPSDTTSPLGRSFAGTTDQLDPIKSLRSMESSVRSADRVGKQTMGGRSVEHYRLTVDTAALVKKLGPMAAQATGLPHTLTYDLYLDEQHRLRRVSFDLAGVSFESTMSRWGTPVRIHRPAPGQVARTPGA